MFRQINMYLGNFQWDKIVNNADSQDSGRCATFIHLNLEIHVDIQDVRHAKEYGPTHPLQGKAGPILQCAAPLFDRHGG
jgi:hypothetical protein